MRKVGLSVFAATLLPSDRLNRKLTSKSVQTATLFTPAKTRLLILPAALNVSKNDFQKLFLEERNERNTKSNFRNPSRPLN